METGKVIEGRYTLGSRLTADGPLETYLALDTTSCEPVSVQLLRTEGAPSAELCDAFEQQARRLMLLSHPSLVEILAYGVDEGVPYIVTADADSANLGRMLERGAELGIERALRVLAQVSEALETAHARGFQHGRLGPEHVFFAADGRAVISGLGMLQLLDALAIDMPEASRDEEQRAAKDRSALWSISVRSLATPPREGAAIYPDLAGVEREETSLHVSSRPRAMRWARRALPDHSTAKSLRARLPLLGAMSALVVIVAAALT